MALFIISQPLYRQNFAGYFYGIGMLLCSAQPIISTCITMTKPDVRKAVLDFFSCSWAMNRAKNTGDKNDLEVDIAELQETNDGDVTGAWVNYYFKHIFSRV
jgi:hypothetical protein